MDIDWGKLEEACILAGSRTIMPVHFATVTSYDWGRAKLILHQYALDGAIKESGSSRFLIPWND